LKNEFSFFQKRNSGNWNEGSSIFSFLVHPRKKKRIFQAFFILRASKIFFDKEFLMKKKRI